MIIQRLRVLNTNATAVNFTVESLFAGISLMPYSIMPAWITVTNDITGRIAYITIQPTLAGITTGEFTYDFTTGGSPSEVDARLIIEVVESLTEPIDTCNKPETATITWITREGGRATYLFDQRKNYSQTTGESRQYDNGGVIKQIYNGKNFDTVTVYKTGLSIAEVQLLTSLRQSIQRWEYDVNTNTCKPIIITLESFPEYNTKENMREVRITYRYATYKEIQVQ